MILAPVLAALLLSSPAPLSEPVDRAAPAVQADPAVATDGRDFLVAWTDWRYGVAVPSDVYATRVSAEGDVLDPGGILVAATAGVDERPSIVFNGSSYVIATVARDEGIRLTELSRAGTILQRRAIPLSEIPIDVALAWNGSVYALAWTALNTESAAGGLRTMIVDSLLRPATPAYVATRDGAVSVDAASNGTMFGVAWTVGGTMRFLTMNAGGVITSAAPSYGNDVGSVSVASDGTDFVVAHGGRPAEAVRFNAAAATLSRQTFTDIPDVASTAVLWDGARFDLSWTDRPAGTPLLRLNVARLDATLSASEAPRQVTIANHQQAPALATNGLRTLLVFAESPDDADILGVFYEHDRFGAYSPDRFLVSTGRARQRIVATAWSGDVLGTLWVEGDTFESAYFGRFTPDGRPLDGGGIPLGLLANPSLAASGEQFVVVHEKGGISAIRFGHAGPALAEVRVSPTGSLPVAGSDGRDFLIGWTDGAARSATLTASGAVSEPRTLSPESPRLVTFRPVRIAHDPSGYTILLRGARNTRLCDGPFCLYDDELDVLRPDGTIIPVVALNGLVSHMASTALALDGDELLVAWEETAGESRSLHLKRLRGSLVLDSGAGIDTGLPLRNLEAVWDGSRWIVGGTEKPDLYTWQLHLLTVDRDGRVEEGSTHELSRTFFAPATFGLAAHPSGRVAVAYSHVTPVVPEVHNGGVPRGELHFVLRKARAVRR